jgi:biotin carboxyl carrier protein
VRVNGTPFTVEIDERSDGGRRVHVDGRRVDVDARLSPSGAGSLLLDGVSYLVDVGEVRGETQMVVDGEPFRVQVDDRPGTGGIPARGAGAEQRLVAPMPGKVVAVLVEVGRPVERGAGLVVLEAMKMENEFRATGAGVVTEIHVSPGQTVNAGDLLVVVA